MVFVMIDANRAKTEGFGCSPINPVACQTCEFMTRKYSANCLVYSEDIGAVKPDDVYRYGKPCKYYSKKKNN